MSVHLFFQFWQLHIIEHILIIDEQRNLVDAEDLKRTIAGCTAPSSLGEGGGGLV